jgi:hypothetical protein
MVPVAVSLLVLDMGSDRTGGNMKDRNEKQTEEDQEMDEYTQHEVISEMSEEEKVENDIAGWGDTPETTDTHLVWVFNENCLMSGKPWMTNLKTSDSCPMFVLNEWRFSPEQLGDLEDTFKDIFGDDFPAGDVSYLTGTREELEAKIYGEGEQA